MVFNIGKKKITSIVLTFLLLSTSLILLLTFPSTTGDPPFSENKRVNSDEVGVAAHKAPSLAVDPTGNAYVVWGDSRNPDWDIYFAKSTDWGETWTDPNIKVNTGSENQTFPAMAIDSKGTLYVVWEDDRNGDSDIYFAKSTDGGQTWTNPNKKVNIDTAGDGFPNMDQNTPCIAVDSEGTIYVAWTDDRWDDTDIYFAKSTNGGVDWTNPNVRINTDSTSTTQRNPTIAVDSEGVIYIAWQDQITGDYDIHFARSTDGGGNWTKPSVKVNSDTSSREQNNPSIAVDSSGTIFLVWQDNRWNNYDIYYAKSTNGGTSWTHPNIKINSDTGSARQYNPSLAVSYTGTLYAAWHDYRNANADIYFAYSTNQGENWTHPNLRVNQPPTDTQHVPAIAVGINGPVYVAWQDDRGGFDDIYSANINPVNPFPTADLLSVEGFLGTTPGIQHIIPHNPIFSFTYNDPNSDPLSQYNISLWDSGGSNLLWWCNRTSSVSSGSEVSVKYNNAPCPANGPTLVDGSSYRLRAKVENITGVWSPFSEVAFHLNEVLPPTTPVYPADNSLIESSATQSVIWSSPGRDAEGDSPESYSWEVSMNPEFTTLIDSGSQLVNESNPFNTRPSGYFYWRVKLNDGWETSSYGNQPDGYWAFSTFTPTPQNNPPTITNKGSEPDTSTVGSFIDFMFTATDPDSDPLSWGKISGPSWLRIGTDNGRIYGTPSSEDQGTNNFTIQVSDGKGGSDNHTFTIQIEDTTTPNNPPVITNKAQVPDKTAVNITMTFTFTATDPDSDPLTWSKLSGPHWLDIGIDNGTIFGMPSIENLGSNTFTIQVSDGRGGTDNHTFTITVDTTLDGDGDGVQKDDEFPFLCLVLILIILVLVILILIALWRRKKSEEEEEPLGELKEDVEKVEEPPKDETAEEKIPYTDEEEEPPPPDAEPLPIEDDEPPPPDD
ncbi:MAG: exo-alpha-sialidase [Thermoplasmata archaeon]|nr:MAG: exo-alpha-sialidase [Thermoplasmata archaeon]